MTPLRRAHRRMLAFYRLGATCLVLALVFATAPARASADAPVTLRIATTPAPSARVTHDPDRPGWIIELFNRVETRANVTFDYVFVPWDQCLRMVRTGLVQAAFNSSYKAERAEYGAYPMKDGVPDTSRATLDYAYQLYAHNDAGLDWDGKTLSGLATPLAVERKAAIVPILDKLGIPYQEAATYTDMLTLVRTRRASGMAAVTETMDTLLARTPGAADEIVKLSPPLQERAGYLMFSKRYCARYGDVCEAVWDAIGEVRRSPEYQTVKLTYDND